MNAISGQIKTDRLRCPVCSGVYGQGDVHVVHREKSRRIVHVSCPKCEATLFLSLENHPFGMMGVGVPTDLSFSEAIAVSRKEPITSDVVISVYRELYGKR